MFGAYVFIAQYLQLVLGPSPLAAGTWTLPWALVTALLRRPLARQRGGNA